MLENLILLERQRISCRFITDSEVRGFAFEGEFVADSPICLGGDVSEVTIVPGMTCDVRIIRGAELQQMFDEDVEKMHIFDNTCS